MTKTELLEQLSTGSDLTKKQVGQVLDVLGEVIGTELGKKGSGIFILPGLLKISRPHEAQRRAVGPRSWRCCSMASSWPQRSDAIAISVLNPHRPHNQQTLSIFVNRLSFRG